MLQKQPPAKVATSSPVSGVAAASEAVTEAVMAVSAIPMTASAKIVFDPGLFMRASSEAEMYALPNRRISFHRNSILSQNSINRKMTFTFAMGNDRLSR
jgi:hypothetical protein